MRTKWIATGFALALTVGAAAQNSQDTNPQDHPVLKTRPADSQPSQPITPPDFSSASAQSSNSGTSSSASPDAIPQGTRFILRLRDPLDTHTLEQGQHFEAELTQDLVSPSGQVIPKGELVRAHVATFERGYTGARLMLAMDDIDTPRGWVPLIATFTGIPGDPSIKSTGQEGEITQKGPDKKRVITNAAIGAGIGAATGAAAGGGKGALAGVVAGAGLGTATSFIFKNADLKLDKGTNMEVRLDRDLVVPNR
jgi:hypothetical protein